MQLVRLVAVSLVVVVGAASAQTPADSPVTPEPTAPPPPPVSPAVPDVTPPPLPAEPRLPQIFHEQFIAVDSKGNTSVGTSHRPLTRQQFFELAGRPDLVEASLAASHRRAAFVISGAAVLAAGAVAAVALLATIPDVRVMPCANLVYYRDVCQAIVQSHTLGGVLSAAGAATVGALLFTLAYWSTPDVLDRDEATALASKYNAALKKRLMEGVASPPPEPSGFRLLPVIGPGGVGLVAWLTFP